MKPINLGSLGNGVEEFICGAQICAHRPIEHHIYYPPRQLQESPNLIRSDQWGVAFHGDLFEHDPRKKGTTDMIDDICGFPTWPIIQLCLSGWLGIAVVGSRCGRELARSAQNTPI